MFSNILGTLTSFVPRSFIFGSYVPVLIFGFLNGWLLFSTDSDFAHFAAVQLKAASLMAVSVAFAGSIIVAYILAAISDWLRELLEGKNIWPPFVEQLMRSRERIVLDRYESQLNDANVIVDCVNPAQISKWTEALHDASVEGHAGHTNVSLAQTHTAIPKSVAGFLSAVRIDRSFKLETLENAVSELQNLLKTHDSSADVTLARTHRDMLVGIEQAYEAAQGRALRAFVQRHVWFGSTVEPTRMGNVAAAIQDYAFSRYGIDLDMFWGRAQSIVQKNDEKSYGGLVDAKTQLDFLVECFWLASLSTVVWLITFIVVGTATLPVTIVALAGLVLPYGFYQLALRNYLAYGAIVRATIDLNRFGVLRALHMPVPGGISEERQLWEALRDLSSLGSKVVEISYEHPAP